MSDTLPFPITPLTQRDPRWKDVKLGFSNYTIGTHGCTLTILTAFLNYVLKKSYTPKEVNIALKAHKAFSGGLISWANVTKAFPQLKFIKRVDNYNNIEVSFNIYIRRIPVMVEVNASRIGAPKHWVLFLGKGMMFDPWDGKIKPILVNGKEYYRLTGYSVFAR